MLRTSELCESIVTDTLAEFGYVFELNASLDAALRYVYYLGKTVDKTLVLRYRDEFVERCLSLTRKRTNEISLVNLPVDQPQTKDFRWFAVLLTHNLIDPDVCVVIVYPFSTKVDASDRLKSLEFALSAERKNKEKRSS